ncbi:SIR2 family protein [Erwinia tasmaniensis]|uniref:Probable phage-related protein n=1 Tax=Erwinia tasmaniensis (strain DSM 17950 / CFBP 7177 / CIP 109463 / NCPPB 4357 / Et1/99) TaxID=465817 RepID=B2VJT6_ERWT9|nr:SIR2 family protein [Erwinia tasmaniensis]CAO98281.1 probable phage-related protein [Erwinia tasmaniensis Et1/99]
MNINDFVRNYKNHPVLFVGTGFSLRYLTESFSWDALLKRVVIDLRGNVEEYFDIRYRHQYDGKVNYEKVASDIEDLFNTEVSNDRYGPFSFINDEFYKDMEAGGGGRSRFKMYLAHLLRSTDYKLGVDEEIKLLTKARKNIGSIITTNYDLLIEKIFEFNPLIGNNILLSNPYGSVYKIHGCVTDSEGMIITDNDYHKFNQEYELIRAQLLSLFIHNPIIFIGYSISDSNIKDILKTIFSCVDYRSEMAERIRRNFLLVEHDSESQSDEVVEHDIDIEGLSTIRINKIKTNAFSNIYNSISNLLLPVSAMDIRKVQSVWGEIRSGGDIKVSITEDIDSLSNGDMVLAVGSSKTIRYEYQTTTEMMQNYFRLVEEENYQLILLLNKQRILATQHFPFYAFGNICPELTDIEDKKIRQRRKIDEVFARIPASCQADIIDITEITNAGYAQSKQFSMIFYSAYREILPLKDVKNFLINFADKKCTDYRRLLCLYDMKAPLPDITHRES